MCWVLFLENINKPSYVFVFQFTELLVRHLKEALKTGEFDNALLIVSKINIPR